MPRSREDTAWEGRKREVIAVEGVVVKRAVGMDCGTCDGVVFSSAAMQVARKSTRLAPKPNPWKSRRVLCGIALHGALRNNCALWARARASWASGGKKAARYRAMPLAKALCKATGVGTEEDVRQAAVDLALQRLQLGRGGGRPQVDAQVAGRSAGGEG